jgi:phosphate transport system substrate-binding protein
MKLKNLIAISLLAAPTAALAGTTLNGAGATFPAPIYQRWFQDYARTSGNVFL